MAPIETTEPVKAKKEKKDKSAKKRAREEEAQADGERKQKKSKSAVDPNTDGGEVKAEKKEKKKKKKSKDSDATATEETTVAGAAEESPKKSKKSKLKTEEHQPEDETPSKKEKKKKSKKSKAETASTDATSEPTAAQEVTEEREPDAMDVDTEAPSKPSSKIHAPSDIPPSPQFPFYTQTISLYEPLFPPGWAKPISGCESQHLHHLKDRYVPAMHGVLLDYHNIALGEKPGRKGAAKSDESYTTLTTKNEFGGGFGWVTADVKLFVPSRGAWMEGSVNLQTEGHIGVVCFGKFNASIEALRLPKSWTWVPNESDNFEETASVVTGAEEHGVVRQLHSTGYWVDADGEKIKGRVRFRIRNFDVGVSGPSTYLSLQGTMLNKEEERALVTAEAKEAQERKEKKGGKWRARRTLPDFSMTKFETAVEEEETTAPEALDTSGVQYTEE